MTSNLTNLTVSENSFVDEGANQHADILLFKAKGSSQMDAAAIEKSLTDTKVELTKANDQVKTLTADIAKAKTDLETITKERDSVLKSLDEKTAEITKLAADKAELVEKAATAELISEVQKLYPHTKGTDAEKASVLKSLKAIPDEAVRKTALDQLAAAEALAKAAAVEKGEGQDVNKKNAATGEPQKDFDALVAKAMTDQKLTKAAATDFVMKSKEGVALYTKIREKAVKS